MTVSDRANLVPAGPPKGLIAGHLLPMSRDPLKFFLSNRQYGDVVRLQIGPITGYQISDPELLAEVLVRQASQFEKAPIYKRILSAYLGNGLLISDGDFWKRQRKLAQPAFHTRRVDAYAETMVGYTQSMLATWQPGQTRDIADEMMQLTLFIVGKTLFDVDFSADRSKIGEALEALLHDVMREARTLIPRPRWLPNPARRRKERTIALLDEVTYHIIQQRHEAIAAAGYEDRGDLLSMLMQARDDDDQPMTDKQLRDEALTIVLAGHETTANALTWTLYLLSQHPQVEATLYEEIQSVLGERPPTLADLKHMPYTEQVIKEGLRLYPPAWNYGRQAIAPVQLGDYTIPAYSVVFITPWAIHRDPRWYPQPERFDPGRFTPENEAARPRYAYLPFGGGPRVCIGSSFAMMEARLILALVIQRFRLTLAASQRVEPEPLLTLRPRYGMKMTLQRR